MDEVRELVLALKVGLAQLSELQAQTVEALRDLKLTQKQVLTKDEAAAYLNISAEQMGAMCRMNQIAYSRIGKRIYIALTDIEKLASRCRQKSLTDLDELAQKIVSEKRRLS